jgi:hypothetical protein
VWALGVVAAENALAVGAFKLAKLGDSWPMALDVDSHLVLGFKLNLGEHCFDSVDNVGGGHECGKSEGEAHFTWTMKCKNKIEFAPGEKNSWISPAFKLFHTAAEGELELKNGVAITKKYPNLKGKTLKLCDGAAESSGSSGSSGSGSEDDSGSSGSEEDEEAAGDGPAQTVTD